MLSANGTAAIRAKSRPLATDFPLAPVAKAPKFFLPPRCQYSSAKKAQITGTFLKEQAEQIAKSRRSAPAP